MKLIFLIFCLISQFTQGIYGYSYNEYTKCYNKQVCKQDSQCEIELSQKCSYKSDILKDDQNCQVVGKYKTDIKNEANKVRLNPQLYTPQQIQDILSYPNENQEYTMEKNKLIAEYEQAYNLYKSDESNKDNETSLRFIKFFVGSQLEKKASYSILEDNIVKAEYECVKICKNQLTNEQGIQQIEQQQKCLEAYLNSTQESKEQISQQGNGKEQTPSQGKGKEQKQDSSSFSYKIHFTFVIIFILYTIIL